MNNDYLGKAYDLMQDENKKVMKLLERLKKKRYDDECSGIDLSFAIGFEKGCLMKDEENQLNLNKINKVDSMQLVSKVENILPLITFLKSNVSDVYIKGRILEELSELSNYIVNTLNISDEEREEI